MAKVSFLLVFTLVVAVPFGSVVGEDNWSSVQDKASAGKDNWIRDKASSVGRPEGALDEAKKALNDDNAQRAAEKVLSDSSNVESLSKVVDGAKKASEAPSGYVNSPAPDEDENGNLNIIIDAYGQVHPLPSMESRPKTASTQAPEAQAPPA